MAAAESLAELARELALPHRDWVILAEGNVSGRIDGSTMRVKASGVQMLAAQPDDMVQVRIDQLLEIIDDADSTDADVSQIFDRVEASSGRRPSVEALLHAVCLDRPGIQVVGHVHPTATLALLCSDDAAVLTEGSLFPDQVVVLGSAPLLVPYVDPGLELARVVRLLLHDRAETPRVIYLQNHGLFALGTSPAEVVQIIEMSVKAARVLLGTLNGQGPRFMDAADVSRIDTRPDEAFRRAALAAFSHSDVHDGQPR